MIERKLFEKVDDNPGDYFGMLVEGYDSTYASVMKQADSDAQKLRDSWEKDGGKSLFDTLSELGYESDYEDSPYMFKDADGGNTIVFDFRPINSFEDYVTYYVVDKDNRIPDGWTKTKLMIDFWKDKNESLKENRNDIEYIKWVQLPNKKWAIWGSSSSSKLDPEFLDGARKKNSENYLDAKISKNGEYPDGVSEEDVVDYHRWGKDESLKEDKKETLKESRTVDYLELDLAEKSGDEDVYNAYDENELTIVKDGNVWYFEHCPNGLDKKVKKLMKKYYPELTYLYESLKEDSEYKTLAKLSNGLEVISYPYGYAVSDGYTADRFVVRDGKYIFDDGRFRLSDKDKEKILSLIKKGVIEESLKESYSKSDLYSALEYMYGFNKKEANDWIKKASDKMKQSVVDAFKDNAKKSALTDSLKEDKFVSRDKMSKKDRKELDSKKRNTWGSTNPVTKVHPNKKAYDRKRDKKELAESTFENALKAKDGKIFMDTVGEKLIVLGNGMQHLSGNERIKFDDIVYYYKLLEDAYKAYGDYLKNSSSLKLRPWNYEDTTWNYPDEMYND